MFGLVVESLSEGVLDEQGGQISLVCVLAVNRAGLKESSAEGKGMLRMPLGSRKDRARERETEKREDVSMMEEKR